MSDNVFFITGYPRSRTGWLANLFTVPPQSMCLHDVAGVCRGVEDLRAQISGAKGYQYVGVSDPALALVWREVAGAWPEAKWVVVRRDKFEAARSYAAFLERHGHAMGWEQVRVAMERWEREIEELVNHLRSQAWEISFEELDREEKVDALWAWLFEGQIGWSAERFEMLRRLNVQTMAEKAGFGVGRSVFAEWVGKGTTWV